MAVENDTDRDGPIGAAAPRRHKGGALQNTPTQNLPWRSVTVIAGGYLVFGLLWILISDWAVAVFTQTPEAVAQWQTYKGAAFIVLSTGVLVALIWCEQARARALTDYWHRVIDHAQEGFWLIDDAGHTQEVNRALADLLGHERDTIVGRTPFAFVDEAGRRVFAREIGSADEPGLRHQSAEPRTYEITMLSAKGESIPTLFHATSLRDRHDRVVGSYAFVTDLRGMRRRERELRLTRHALAHSFDAIFRTDADGRIVDANKTACERLGYHRDELLALSIPDIDTNFSAALWPDHWRTLKRARYLRFETEHRHRDGHTVPVEMTLTYLDYDGEEYNFAVARDISERKAAEHTNHRTNKALRALSRANSALVHAEDEATLMHEVCRALTESQGYPVAWVGRAEWDTARTVRPVGMAGSEAGYVERINVSWGDNELSQGPAGRAIREGRTQIVHDIARDESFRPWRGQARLSGLASLVSIPIRAGGAVTGVLNVYSESAHAFDGDEITLLEELAADVAYGAEALHLRAEHRRQLGELRLAATVFDNSAEGILVTDPRQRIVAVNRAFTRITGYSEAEVLGQPPSILQSGTQDRAFYRRMWAALRRDGIWQGEIWNHRKNGEIFPEWLTVSEVRNDHGDIVNYVAVFADITDAYQAQEEITFHAYHDHLTRLPNRALFRERLERSLAALRADSGCLAVVLLDLEGFGAINDSLGPEAGDLVLRETAHRLEALLNEADTLARPGGDEFWLLLESLEHSTETDQRLKDLREALSAPITVDGQTLRPGSSLGVALAPGDGTDAEALLTGAATALHRAQRAGSERIQYYQADMHRQVQRQVRLAEALKTAIEEGELRVWYQPQVALDSGRLVGIEALVRWEHQEWGLVSPGDFIPIAEETGLVVPLGEWVLDHAVAQCAAWRARGLAIDRLGVNVAAAQLQSGEWPDRVAAALERSGLPPACLELEITEQGFLEDIERTAGNIDRLAALGTRLAIDDFGTGYSSLAYLKRLPVDTLKIDKAFIDGLPDDEHDCSIVRAIMAVAGALELDVLPEGVETREQADWLQGESLRLVQGFLYAAPMPADRLEAWLDEDNNRRQTS